MLAQQAQRFQPTLAEVNDDIIISAQESAEERIKRALTEKEEDYPFFVRPLCMIATISANAVADQKALQLPCPEDEFRNAGLPIALRSVHPNIISLYPMGEESYGTFAASMCEVQGMGEYAVFSRTADGGWQMDEFV